MPTEILLRVANHAAEEDPYVDVTLLSEGEAVVVVDERDAKRAWDQMLANGRVTQAQHDASKRPDGTHRWPWGTQEANVAHWRIVETDMTKLEALALLAREPGDRAVDPMLRPRLFRLDLASLPPMQRGSVTNIDAATLRAAREDAPKRDDPGVL